MNLQGTYDERTPQRPRASSAAPRTIIGPGLVGTVVQPVNHCRKRTRTGTWMDSQLAVAVAAVDGGSKIATAA